jgi:cellobionic acid phosphorylase
VVEGLCGLHGDAEGLRIAPQLPAGWDGMKIQRSFRGASFNVAVRRTGAAEVQVRCNGELLPAAHVSGIEAGKHYELEVSIP